MSNKKRGLLAIIIFVISTLLISACTQSLSSAAVETPTLIATGLFVSPFPSAENPMAQIEEFAKQTAAAQTTIANGGTAVTPQAIVTVTGTPNTPTSAPTLGTPSTPTNAVVVATTAVIVPSGPTTTPVPPGVRPSSYTLQAGEHPFCIARRFNVDPDELLSLSGLTREQAYSLVVGTVLKIPQSGSFPGARALTPHPTTYTVLSGEETPYSVACKFGDVDPAAIASANGISISANLIAGQALQIP